MNITLSVNSRVPAGTLRDILEYVCANEHVQAHQMQLVSVETDANHTNARLTWEPGWRIQDARRVMLSESARYELAGNIATYIASKIRDFVVSVADDLCITFEIGRILTSSQTDWDTCDQAVFRFVRGDARAIMLRANDSERS